MILYVLHIWGLSLLFYYYRLLDDSIAEFFISLDHRKKKLFLLKIFNKNQLKGNNICNKTNTDVFAIILS